jgi:hypothetical protein
MNIPDDRSMLGISPEIDYRTNLYQNISRIDPYRMPYKRLYYKPKRRKITGTPPKKRTEGQIFYPELEKVKWVIHDIDGDYDDNEIT